MRAAEKRLDEMNRLSDMLHFPAMVNAGATVNVMVTVLVTWLVEPNYPALAGVWVAVVLVANLLPVVVMRATGAYGFPGQTARLGEMDFFRDQHKFSDWVYLAASANMAFWILLSWTACALFYTPYGLAGVEILALLCTFSPVLFRWAGGGRD